MRRIALIWSALVLVFSTLAWAQSALISGNRTIAGGINACGPSGGPDAYACVLSPPLTVMPTGACFTFIAVQANNGASTLAVNGQAPVALTKRVAGISTPLASGDIGTGQLVTACYDGSTLQVQSFGGEEVPFTQLPQLGQNEFYGRVLTGTGDATALTLAQVKSVLGITNVSITGPTVPRTYIFPDIDSTLVPASRTINNHDLTANVVLTKDDIGLGNVDNTADAAKTVMAALALAADPQPCDPGQFATDIAANGLLSCAAPTGTRHTIQDETVALSDDAILRFAGNGVACVNGTGGDVDKIICTITGLGDPTVLTAASPFSGAGNLLTSAGANRTTQDSGTALSAVALKNGGGTQQLSGSAWLPRWSAITLNQSPTPSVVAGPATADVAYHYTLTGSILFGAPTGAVQRGQTLDFVLKSATPVPLAWTSGAGGYCAQANIPLPTTTTGGGTHYNRYKFEWNDNANCYLFIGQSASVQGEAGNSVTFAELDGAPGALFTTIKVPNNSLTDNGDNSATLDLAQTDPPAAFKQTMRNTDVVKRVQPLTTVVGAPGTLQIDCSLYDEVTITAQDDPLQFQAPNCTPTDGQYLTILVASGSSTEPLTFVTGASAFVADHGIPVPTSTLADMVLATQWRWNAALTHWSLVGATLPISGTTVRKYVAAVTAATTLDVAGTLHNLGSADLHVACWEVAGGDTSRQYLPVVDAVVDTDDYDVHFTWSTAQTARCVITG